MTAAAGVGSFSDVTVTTLTGPPAARAATVKTDPYDVTTLRQPNVATPRQVTFERTADTMTTFRDALDRATTFGYTSNGLISSITAPGGVQTSFGYDASRRVTSVTQLENASGGPGSSTTRLAYPSATQTLLAAPDTNQGQAVDVVPHTTYTVNATQRVSSVVDAAGRTRSTTYTANFDTATATSDTGAGAATTTNTYGANSGESRTKSASPTGAARSLTYTNPAGPSQYLPSGGSDDAGNASTYTYNGAGNPLTSTNAIAAQAKLTYASNGVVATATSPGNGTNSTGYAHTNKQLASTTPPTGTSLGARAFTYDQYGRTATTTNGRGVTTTYAYDVHDRVTSVSFSTGPGVSYGYDTAGRNNSRVDTHGTTSYSYDQLGRLTARGNTAYGGTIAYSYDTASNLASVTSAAGETTTYTYDAAGTPTAIFYPHEGAQRKLEFATDTKGRRTGTWLQSANNRTSWAARNLTTYDNTGRVSRVTAHTGPGDSSNTAVVDTSYCYVKGTVAPTCTANTANDRNKMQWQRNNLTGAVTTYTYDSAGRLTKAAVTGTGAVTYNYTYNANGNRLTATQQAQTLTYNPGNQITSTGYTYDGAGNLTAQPGNGTMTYTSADQLNTVAKNGTTYTYKHAGTTNNEIVGQVTPDGTYQLAYGRTNSLGLPVIEAIGQGAQNASVTSDPITGQPLMLRTSTGMQSLYIYDGSPGSPIALLTSAAYQAFAYQYDPYGVPTLTEDSGGSGVPQNPYLFAGGLQDRVTGWVHYGQRYYDPQTGSFTQQDSLDAPLDPTNGNRYAYAGNDPINNTDPTGQRGCIGNVLLAAGATVSYFGGASSLIASGVGSPVGVGLFLLGAGTLPYSYQDAYESCR